VTTAQLDSVFSALADPTRRAILTRLASGEATVTELAEPFDVTLPAISKHVKVLERAGLVERGREAQRRPCRLCPDPLREALGWLAGQSAFWEGSFDRLATHLEAIQREARR
jgi:DNA-binding transcriptional ArsR family regulator